MDASLLEHARVAMARIVEARRPDTAATLAEAARLEGAGELGRAAAALAEALRIDPLRREALEGVVRIRLACGALDAAWCAASARAALGGEPVEADFLEDHRPRRLPATIRPLDEAGWRLLRHADDDPAPVLDAISILLPAPTSTAAAAAPSGPAPALAWAEHVLGLAPPSPEALAPRTARNAPIPGGSVDVLLFRAGHAAAHRRPAHAALARALDGDAMDRLDVPARRDVARWQRGVERTALRAGLLVCGDVELAARLVLTDRRSSPLERAEAVEELLAFAASPAHAALRAMIGLSIDAVDDAEQPDPGEAAMGALDDVLTSLDAPTPLERDRFVRAVADFGAAIDRGSPTEELEAHSLGLTALARGLAPGFVRDAARGLARAGGAAAFTPVRLEVDAEPHEERRRWSFGPQLRPHVVVIADFTGRPDPRPVEDRGRWRIERETFDKRLKENLLRFTVETGGQSLEVKVTCLAEFDAPAVAEQLAVTAGLRGDDLARAVDAIFRHPPFLQAERAWRSLRRLLDATREDVVFETVTCSKTDLAEDFEDAPEPSKSGLYRVCNDHNHGGMHAPSLVVLDHELDPGSRDLELLRAVAGTGRLSVVPVLAGLAPGASAPPVVAEPEKLTAWRASPDAAYLALVGPGFVVRRSTHGTLRGSGAFLAATLVVRNLGRYLWGGPVLGSVSDVELDGALDAELARTRGYLAFFASPAGASLRSDVGFATAEWAPSSLSAALLVTRMAHQVLDIDNRAPSTWTEDGETARARFDRRLAARFAALEGVQVTLSELRGAGWGRFDANLTVTLPSPTSRAGTTVGDRLSFRVEAERRYGGAST